MTAHDLEEAAAMSSHAWDWHVAGVLVGGDAHRQLIDVLLQRPCEAVRRHVLVDVDTQDADAEAKLIAGFKTLTCMGLRPTDSVPSKHFLPALLIAEGLAPGLSLASLERAMHRLTGRGTLVRVVVGQHRNNLPEHVLQLAPQEARSDADEARSHRRTTAVAIDERRPCGEPASGAALAGGP